MKKALAILVALTLGSVQSIAQVSYPVALQKGSILTGGASEVSFGKATSKSSDDFGSDEDESGYQSLSFTPNVAYFLNNGLALGVLVDVTSTSYQYDEDGYSDKETSTQYSIGPVLRYYAPGGFFVHGDISFGKMIEKYEYEYDGDSDSEKNDANLMQWKLGIGYAFFLNDYISLEPTIVYRKTGFKFEDEYGNFEGKLGEFVIGAGFNIFLHKKNQ